MATAIATFSLVASMCPSAAALAYGNEQLATGSSDLQAQAPDESEIYTGSHLLETGTYYVKDNVTIESLCS